MYTSVQWRSYNIQKITKNKKWGERVMNNIENTVVKEVPYRNVKVALNSQGKVVGVYNFKGFRDIARLNTKTKQWGSVSGLYTLTYFKQLYREGKIMVG